jgi:transposase
MNLGALALRRDGHGYRAIAAMLGLSVRKTISGVARARREQIRQEGARGLRYRATTPDWPSQSETRTATPDSPPLAWNKPGWRTATSCKIGVDLPEALFPRELADPGPSKAE